MPKTLNFFLAVLSIAKLNKCRPRSNSRFFITAAATFSSRQYLHHRRPLKQIKQFDMSAFEKFESRGGMPNSVSTVILSSQQRIFCYGDSLTAGTSPPNDELHPYGPYLEHSLRSIIISSDDNREALSRKTKVDPQTPSTPIVRWFGLPGWTAEAMAQSLSTQYGLDAMLRSRNVNLAIILAGTNDLAYEKNSRKILDSILALHEAAHGEGVPTLAIGIPTSGWQSVSEETRVLAQSVNEGLKSWVEDKQQQQRQGKMQRSQQSSKEANNSSKYTSVDYTPFPIQIFERNSGLWSPDGLHFSPSGYKFIGTSLASVVKEILNK